MNPRKIGKILLFGIAGSLVAVLGLMLAVKLALDSAPRNQAEIKLWVHEWIGYNIAFVHVSPAFRWYGPELYFDQMELRSKDNQRVLARAGGGRIGVDLWQFLRGGKLFALRIELDSPDILIARTGPNTFALGSEIVLGGDDSSWSTLALNDLPAGTLAVRQGVVTVQDWNATLPHLELRSVNLDLHRGSDLIALKLAARLPDALGGNLGFDGTASGTGRLDTLDWNVQARARGISFPGWREFLPEYLTRLDAGTGAFAIQAQGRGTSLASAALDFSAQDVVAKLTDGPSAKFEQIGGLLTLIHADDRWTVSGRGVRAHSAERRDPDSEFDVNWRADESGLLELKARASYLRAEALLPLAGLMPQKELRERLRDLAPTGEWMDLSVQLSRGTVHDPWQLQTSAKFRGVGFAPLGRAPGLRGLSGMLAGDANSGRLEIDTQTAVFHWPDQFPQPINLSKFKTTLYWKRTPEEFLVATQDLEMLVRESSIHGKAAWRQPSDASSPILTLAATLDNGNVADAHLFFPHGLIAPGALAWLDRAFIAGRLPHADVVFKGPVWNFPFYDGSGLFLARCNVTGVTLDYQNGWARIEDLVGQAEFRNQGMTAKFTSARTGGVVLDSADARFVDLKNGELSVRAAVHGDASGALQYLRATPLDSMAEKGFSTAQAKGPLSAEVNLFLPFREFDRRRVLVHVNLNDVTLNRVGSTLAATALTGEADIDGAEVARADIRGRILGGAFQMTAHAPRNRPVTRTQLEFRGNFAGAALREALSLPATVAIGGQADWHGVLKMAPEPTRERSLRLTSTLAGLELGLPEPMVKGADGSLPTSVETQWPAAGGMQVRVSMGSVLRAALNLESDSTGMRLDRAALVFGATEPAFSDTQIVNVGGNIEKVDLAGWLRLGAPVAGAQPLSAYLHSAKFEVGQIDYLGLSFLDVAVNLAQSDAGWRISLGGPNVVGSIALPGAGDPAEPWNLEFKSLKFVSGPREAATAGGQPGAADPREVPAINFHAAQLVWSERQLGEVRATLVKQDDGIRLKQLTVTGSSFGAHAKGGWLGKNGGLGRIDGTITSTDVGDTLKQLGFAAVIEAKTGRLDFAMNWTGAPTAEAFEEAKGHVQVVLDKGQIVGLKPGAGRVLGLSSLAELPRRLALDFSDLTDKGLAFDTIRGDFDLHDGSAYTDNVLVKGPAAEIGLIGRVGLKNEDYDQTAVVTGNLGSSSLSLAGFAGGPVIGAAVVLFTQVFKQPLSGLARGYYRITGTWDNPTVERIKSAEAAAATGEAPK
jgi:uncharacterized protein (TIGR02099 family)